MDWQEFVRTVRSSRTAGAVYWPLYLAGSWLGAAVPDGVLAALAPWGLLRKLVGAGLQPAAVLNGPGQLGPGGDVLYRLLIDVSLHTGCPVPTQIGSAVRGFFPPPDTVGHLPPEVTTSPIRYGTFLTRPGRLFRGLIVFNRLVVRALDG
jgi:hypothetical protein